MASVGLVFNARARARNTHSQTLHARAQTPLGLGVRLCTTILFLMSSKDLTGGILTITWLDVQVRNGLMYHVFAAHDRRVEYASIIAYSPHPQVAHVFAAHDRRRSRAIAAVEYPSIRYLIFLHLASSMNTL